MELCDRHHQSFSQHDDYIAAIIWPCIIKEVVTTNKQPPLKRFLEKLLLGDPRQRGHTHQWTYDRINLHWLLIQMGFRDITIEKCHTSSVPDWARSGLDTDEAGLEYHPGSLYIEARK